MRARTTIFILFLAIIFVMAGNVMQVAQQKGDNLNVNLNDNDNDT